MEVNLNQSHCAAKCNERRRRVVDDVAFAAGDCVLFSNEAVVKAKAGSDWLLAYRGALRV